MVLSQRHKVRDLQTVTSDDQGRLHVRILTSLGANVHMLLSSFDVVRRGALLQAILQITQRLVVNLSPVLLWIASCSIV